MHQMCALINSPEALCASWVLVPHAKACISRSGAHAERKRLTEARRPASSSCILELRCWKWKCLRRLRCKLARCLWTTAAAETALIYMQWFLCSLSSNTPCFFFLFLMGRSDNIARSHHVTFNSFASVKSESTELYGTLMIIQPSLECRKRPHFVRFPRTSKFNFHLVLLNSEICKFYKCLKFFR